MPTPYDAGEILRAYLVAGDSGNDAALKEALHDDVVTHSPGGLTVSGVDAQVATWAAARSGLSRLKHEIADVVTSGERAVARVKVSGIHSGRFLGVEATGAELTVDQALFVRCVDGRIAEMWEVVDTGAGLQQLGVLGGQPLSPGS